MSTQPNVFHCLSIYPLYPGHQRRLLLHDETPRYHLQDDTCRLLHTWWVLRLCLHRSLIASYASSRPSLPTHTGFQNLPFLSSLAACTLARWLRRAHLYSGLLVSKGSHCNHNDFEITPFVTHNNWCMLLAETPFTIIIHSTSLHSTLLPQRESMTKETGTTSVTRKQYMFTSVTLLLARTGFTILLFWRYPFLRRRRWSEVLVDYVLWPLEDGLQLGVWLWFDSDRGCDTIYTKKGGLVIFQVSDENRLTIMRWATMDG
jgi:hypothetical protein